MNAFIANLIIPAPDALPLPAPPWLLHTLLLVTFLAHLLAMNAMLGGLLIALWRSLRPDPEAPKMPALIVKTTPTLVATTVTLGVAPLLFLQTLMGQHFFTSSILMGWGWFSIVPVLIVAYYGAYLQAFKGAGQGHVKVPLLALTTLGILWVGFMFSNNTSLMAAPEVWGDKYFADARGLHLNLGDATLGPRYLHAVLGAVAVAGLFLAQWGTRRHDPAMRRTGLNAFTLLTAVNLLVGMWYLIALPEPAIKAFMGGQGAATMVLSVSLIMTLVILVVGFRLRRAPVDGGLGPLVALVVAVMALMVVMRDQARLAILGSTYRPGEFAVESQWLNIVVFVVLLIAGIAVVWWMARRLAKAWN